MGTSWHATLNSVPVGVRAETLQAGIEQVLKTVNNQMSTWQPDSELSQFNQHRSLDWFPVSAPLVDVVETALQVSAFSDGVYDITVGPLVNLWGFGAGQAAEQPVPTEAEVQTALAKTGYHKLIVQKNPPALRKTDPDLYVDLSSIAKGYGVDQVGLYLEGQAVHDYMVEIGGEVRTRGSSPRGDDWRIAIEKPVDLGRAVQQGMRLHGAGLATSGDYRNFFTDHGKRYSHTLDLKSGHPVEHSLASVSVVADNTTLADAYATMLMAMGEKKALDFAEQQGLSAYFIWRTDQGFATQATPAFQPLLIEGQ
ncbi:MAG: FAD:protein FMN transferase [Thiolinea sp.]